MAQYDGSIRIGTEISTKAAKKSLGTLSNMITLTAKEISSLRSKMDALEKQKTPTIDYKNLQSELAKTEKNLSAFVEKQNAWKNTKVVGTSLWEDLNKEIDAASSNVESIKEKIRSLIDDGKAFTLGTDTAEYANYERQLQYEEAVLEEATKQYQALDKLKDPYGRLSQALTDLNGKLSSILRPIQKIQSAFAQDVKVSGYEKLQSSLGELGGIAIRAAETVKNAFATLKQGPTAVIHGLSSSLMNMANAVNSAIGSVLSSGLEKFGMGIGAVLEKLRQLASGIGSGISSALDVVKEKLAGFAGSVVNLILHPFQTLKNVASTTLGGIANAIKSSLGSAMEGLKNRAAGLAASIINGIVHPFQTLKNVASASVKGTSKLLSGMVSVAKKAGKAISSVGSLLKRAASSMLGFGKSAQKSNSTLGAFGSRFKSLALSLLIFNQISKAFNAMISGMKEGFGNLYKEVGGFKSAIDGLKASTLTLKNSFAAAFRPLVEIAIPYIQKAIDAIANLMNIIGQFTAAITGQKTYTKAIKQTTAAIEDENKAQNKQLSGLDKLNNLSSGSGGASGGGGAGNMFEENVPIEGGISELAEKIKEIFSGIFDVFKEAWESKGQSVIDSAKNALASLAEAAKSVGTTFYEVFTGGAGFAWLESGLELLRSMLDVIGSIATAFTNAWNGGAGIENVTALFGMLSNVNNLLASIGDSFSRAFSNGIGTAIWENILGIITGLYNIIGNLAERIAAAWNTAGLGDSIWNGILSIINTVLGTIHNIADSTAVWVENLDFTPLMQSIDTLLQALQPLMENVGAGLEWFWNNVLLPIAGWAIEDALPVFLNMVSSAIDLLNSVIEVLKPLGEWLWESFLKPLGEWTGEAIIFAMESLTNLFDAVSKKINENKDNVSNFVETIDGILKPALEFLTETVIPDLVEGWNTLLDILNPLGEFVSGVFLSIWNDMLKPAFEFLSQTVLPTVISTFENLWNNVLVPLGNFIASVLKPIIEILSEVFTYLWQNVVVPLAQFIGGVFSSAFRGISDIFNQTVIPIVNAVIKVFQFLWNNVFSPIVGFLRQTFMPVFKSIFETVGTIINNAQKIFGGFIDFIAGVFTGDWERAWDGIVQIFDGVFGAIKGIINGILGVVESLANGVINGINAVIGALNSIHVSIPDWVPGLGGKSFGIDLGYLSNVSIPRLATGTVVPPNNEFLAVLGDNKREPEVVSPLSTIEQAVENAMRRNGGMGGGEITIKIPVEIDGNVLFELIKKLDLEQYNRTKRPSFQM